METARQCFGNIGVPHARSAGVDFLKEAKTRRLLAQSSDDAIETGAMIDVPGDDAQRLQMRVRRNKADLPGLRKDCGRRLRATGQGSGQKTA
jgi:hypothetical protein